jgi:hypothetical protein
MATPPKSPLKLFSSLRTDPAKTSDGVWFENTESGDSLRMRPLMCSQQIKAYIEAMEDYVSQNGEDSRGTEAAELHAEALSTAMGQITDWKLKDNPDMAYDPAIMAATLADPELDELRMWIRSSGLQKDQFRPELVAKT